MKHEDSLETSDSNVLDILKQESPRDVHFIELIEDHDDRSKHLVKHCDSEEREQVDIQIRSTFAVLQ